MEKLKIPIPIVVEGKYDKITLSSVLDAHIITTGGFGIFSRGELLSLIRKIGAERGIIILTDSDGAGGVIRSYISSALPKDKIINLYTPCIAGKERRKKEASKSGLLGVEGMSVETIRRIFEPFADDGTDTSRFEKRGGEITKSDLYADGLSGRPDSAARRAALAESLDLPPTLTANALLEALNLLYGKDSYHEAVEKIKKDF